MSELISHQVYIFDDGHIIWVTSEIKKPQRTSIVTFGHSPRSQRIEGLRELLMSDEITLLPSSLVDVIADSWSYDERAGLHYPLSFNMEGDTFIRVYPPEARKLFNETFVKKACTL